MNKTTKDLLKEKVIKMYRKGKTIGSIAKKLMGKLAYQEALTFVDNAIKEAT